MWEVWNDDEWVQVEAVSHAVVPENVVRREAALLKARIAGGTKYVCLTARRIGKSQATWMGLYERATVSNTGLRPVYKQCAENGGHTWMWWQERQWMVSNQQCNIGSTSCGLKLMSTAGVAEDTSGAWDAWDPTQGWVGTYDMKIASMSEEEVEKERTATYQRAVQSGAEYVRLTGIQPKAHQGVLMGIYQRVPGQRIANRPVYTQPDFDGGSGWLWWHTGEWCCSGAEKNVGTGKRGMKLTSWDLIPEQKPQLAWWQIWDGKGWVQSQNVSLKAAEAGVIEAELATIDTNVTAARQYVKLAFSHGSTAEPISGHACRDVMVAYNGIYRIVKDRLCCRRPVYRMLLENGDDGDAWIWWYSRCWSVSFAEKNVGTSTRTLRVASAASVLEAKLPTEKWEVYRSDTQKWVPGLTESMAIDEEQLGVARDTMLARVKQAAEYVHVNLAPCVNREGYCRTIHKAVELTGGAVVSPNPFSGVYRRTYRGGVDFDMSNERNAVRPQYEQCIDLGPAGQGGDYNGRIWWHRGNWCVGPASDVGTLSKSAGCLRVACLAFVLEDVGGELQEPYARWKTCTMGENKHEEAVMQYTEDVGVKVLFSAMPPAVITGVFRPGGCAACHHKHSAGFMVACTHCQNVWHPGCLPIETQKRLPAVGVPLSLSPDDPAWGCPVCCAAPETTSPPHNSAEMTQVQQWASHEHESSEISMASVVELIDGELEAEERRDAESIEARRCLEDFVAHVAKQASEEAPDEPRFRMDHETFAEFQNRRAMEDARCGAEDSPLDPQAPAAREAAVGQETSEGEKVSVQPEASVLEKLLAATGSKLFRPKVSVQPEAQLGDGSAEEAESEQKKGASTTAKKDRPKKGKKAKKEEARLKLLESRSKKEKLAKAAEIEQLKDPAQESAQAPQPDPQGAEMACISSSRLDQPPADMEPVGAHLAGMSKEGVIQSDAAPVESSAAPSWHDDAQEGHVGLALPAVLPLPEREIIPVPQVQRTGLATLWSEQAVPAPASWLLEGYGGEDDALEPMTTQSDALETMSAQSEARPGWSQQGMSPEEALHHSGPTATGPTTGLGREVSRQAAERHGVFISGPRRATWHGEFYMMGGLYDGRPVYSHCDGHWRLWWQDGAWCIGTQRQMGGVTNRLATRFSSYLIHLFHRMVLWLTIAWAMQGTRMAFDVAMRPSRLSTLSHHGRCD